MDHASIVQTYINAYNAFDVPAMVSLFAEDVVFEHISDGAVVMTLSGKEAFRQQALAAVQYFESRNQTITAYAENGNTVEVELDYHAIAATDLPNGIRAGATIELTGRSIFQFSGDQIIRLTDIV